jgi:serine phosphatase RsbU (regulator of sigma subunit)
LPALLFAQVSAAQYQEIFRAAVRNDAAAIVLGLGISMLGTAAILFFLLRNHSKDFSPLWFGVFAVIYGLRLLMETQILPFALRLSDRSTAFCIFLLTYLVPIPGLLFGNEMFPVWRRYIRWLLGIFGGFAIVAVITDIASGRPGTLRTANNFLALSIWAIAGIAVFRQTTLVSASLRWGVAIFGATIVLTNLRGLGELRFPIDPEPFGFACFIIGLGYALAVRIRSNEERLRELKKELEIATQIQTSILPREMPRLQGLEIAAKYLPMTSVAGDFYEFLPVDDHRIGILIADVAGHGVPAALIASMVKIAIAAQAPHASDPGKVLTGMNQTLCGKMQGQYISAAYLFIDLEARLFRYSGAGHPPLLLWRSAEQRVESLEENGLLLGIMSRAPYTSMEDRFERGDRFLLYTDGLMEAANEKDEFFGEARVRDVLNGAQATSPAACCEALVSDMERFTGRNRGRPPDDDLTVVVLDARRG